MTAPFQLTPLATEDLDAIWWVIAGDNQDAAERVETDILAHLPPAGKTPSHGNQTAGHYATGSAVLDGHEVS